MAYSNQYPSHYPPQHDHGYAASTDSFARPSDPFADPRSGGGGAAYQPVYSNQNAGYSQDAFAQPAAARQQHTAWMDGGKEPEKTSSWKKWGIILGAVVLIVAGVAGGIAAWKVMANKNGNSGSSAGSEGSGTLQSSNGDVSKFTKDDRLKQSFYGFAYTPIDTLMPWCGGTQDKVTADIQLLSQITTRLRTYGSDCNATNMLLQAILDTKVDMQVWLGVYVDDNSTTWERQKTDTLQALQTYGTDHVSGVIVGNEYILLQDSSPASYTFIQDKVAEFRKELDALKLSKTIPVGTADAGSVMTRSLNSHLDFSMANVHPWFGGLPVEQAAGWTWEFFENNDVSVAGNAIPYIAETGWPTDANDTAHLTYQGAVASVDNLQIFLDTFVCQANANQTRYFFFEAFDEPWKKIYGGVEEYWGLFDKDRNLKNVKIPDCPPGDY